LSKKKTTKKKDKSFFKKNKKFFSGFGIGLVLLVGVIVGVKLVIDFSFVEDDNIIDLPDEHDEDGGYITPRICSVKVEDITEYTCTFKVFVLSSEQVTEFVADFKVNDEFLFQQNLGSPSAGWYIKYFTKTGFGDYHDGDIITADLHLTYLSTKDGFYYSVDEYDVISFSFLYEDEEPVTPYYPPEIIPGTFEYSFADTMLTFSFATENYEHITGINYYFVVDGVINDPDGIDYQMIMISNGVFESSFDYTALDLEKTNYIYLEMSFLNEENLGDLKIYEEFAQFGGNSNQNVIGFNFLFSTLVFVSISTMLIIKRKRIVDSYGPN